MIGRDMGQSIKPNGDRRMGGRSGAFYMGVALFGSSILAGLPQGAAAAPGRHSRTNAVPINTDPVSPVPADGTAAAAPETAIPDNGTGPIIQSVVVEGAQRLEPDTVMSYVHIRAGARYSEALADQALKDLYATELFADVQVRNDSGHVVITVKENPVINRIILEGNKNLKEDKINPEIKLAPRQIFTRSKVRADVARIIELYKRQGRFGATVEPKMVMLDQNRVDIVFEITEGPKSKVRQINVIGNSHFTGTQLDAVMLTHASRPLHLFRGGTSYDPDRMAYDQQKLRQYYLTQGYADFRVVSAEAELTPDKRDFIITYVVEEGKRYKFGDIKVDSQLRDFDSEALTKTLPMKKGDWYNAKLVEDTIDRLNESAGIFGYAFADARPDYQRDPKTLTMGVSFQIAEAPRVYVERIDVNGNTLTEDKVVRREFRLAEGDAFNSLQVKRSTNRIKSLGYFQEKFEVAQKPGSAKDRIVLEANVEEKPTGELQLSAGYSSLESFIFQASIQQRNFRGRGQTVGLSGSISRYSKSVDLSFTEPYLFDHNIALGFDIYRRDYNNFNLGSSNNNTIYSQATTGFQVRLGLPLTEYLSLVGRYTLNLDNVSLDKGQFYTTNSAGILACNPLLAGRYLCDEQGKRTSSILGASLVYDNVDNRAHPSRGRVASVGVDVAGAGGSVAYARFRANASQYVALPKGFIFSLSTEGGIIEPLKSRNISGSDDVLLTDRFYLGEPQIRGFDIRGVGPRVVRKPFLTDANGNALFSGGIPQVNTDKNSWQDDALGGRFYYMSRAELEIPLGAGAKELGIRPSIFLDAGAVFGVVHPPLEGPLYVPKTIATIDSASGKPLYYVLNSAGSQVLNSAGAAETSTVVSSAPVQTTIAPFQEFFYGDTPLPRISLGIGFNWNSPFGPFRIDFAKSLLHAKGDDTKSFTFNVGTQF
jgi:outer membrane protein insertion porin family